MNTGVSYKGLSWPLLASDEKRIFQTSLRFSNQIETLIPLQSHEKAAEKYFFNDFLTRHSDVSSTIPESTSLMRTVGFNKLQVAHFFDNLEKLMKRNNFSASYIYNWDETGINRVPKHQKAFVVKSIHQVGKLMSAKNGKNITILFCRSANGYFIPLSFA